MRAWEPYAHAAEARATGPDLVLELIRLDDPWKRAFYENELLRGHWSVRQLQRQIDEIQALAEQRHHS